MEEVEEEVAAAAAKSPHGNKKKDGGEKGRKEEEEEKEGWEEKTAGGTVPSWFADVSGDHQKLQFAPLGGNVSVDVAIVGGGISGLTTGYLLALAGKKVAVLDDGDIASGETGRTTAHATCALDDRYYNIERMHGAEGARLAAESHSAAIDLIESIVRKENIADCDFARVDGYLFLDPSDSPQSLKDELAATRRAGLQTELLEDSGGGGEGEEGDDDNSSNGDDYSSRLLPLKVFNGGRQQRQQQCLRFPNQARLHPLKYMAGLAQAIVRHGGRVYTGTHVTNVTGTGVTAAAVVVAAADKSRRQNYRVSARKIVVATNAPIIDTISKMYERQDAYRTYVIAARVDKGAVPDALYWDTGDHRRNSIMPPYHYARLQKLAGSKDYDLLVVGGEDHETGRPVDAEKCYSDLEEWARQHFPIKEVEYRWSGQVLEPLDSLAFIGRNPNDKRRNVFIATGDSGNGITHGTIAGMILTDLITGKSNRWAKLYDPARRQKRRSRAGPHKQEDEGEQEKGDGEPERPEVGPGELEPGQGTVVEEEDGPVAYYRDSQGRLHSYSAVCTHLGCTVEWNGSEKSFDCPCHGSRFSYAGKVVNGPANCNLEPAAATDKG
ncbi:FAD-dependent oxidoreductase [Nitrososphaera sp.]|uniref:FAD-dependent oxidoreductase n=1 Tax=Nitrososphaera sp. TaxID=1971748 RepID=UPI00307E87A5